MTSVSLIINGEAYGPLDVPTRDAIIAFQRDRNMAETGEINDALMAELAKASGQADSQAQ